MKDENKLREQLVRELNELRQRVAEFNTLESKYKKAHEVLLKSNDELEKRIKEQNKEREQINERLRVIVESTQNITACSRIDEIGKFLLEEFARIMAAEGGSLYRVEHNTLVLDHCLDPGHASDAIPLPPKRGSVLDRILNGEKPILIKDIRKEKNTLRSGWNGYKDGSLIAFPIQDEEGQIAAIITLHNKTSPPFVEQDKEIGLMLVSYSCEALRTIKNTQALRESEKLLKNILSASSVGIAYARERVVAWANEAMEKMFGFEDEKEYLGQTTYQLYASEEEYQRVGKIIYEGIKAGGDLIEADVLFKRKDGSVFDGHVRVSVIDQSNPLQGIVASIIDITEIKRSEELLKESEEKFRNLFDNSIEAVFTVDLKGNFTSINRAVEIISGYSREELIGQNSFDYMKPEFGEEVYQKYNNLFRTGKPIEDLIYVFFDKSGRERTLEGYVNVIRKEDKIIGFQGTLRDITEKKAAEEKLKESEERYRDLVENIEDIVYVIDEKGKAIFINKAAEKSIGYSKEELTKMNYKELITPESYKYAEEIFKRRLSGEDVGVVEHQFKNKKGEVITIETSERFIWKDNRVVEVHGIGRDITERKKAEKVLKESEEKYRNLAEQSLQGLIIAQGVPPRIVYANTAVADILGLTVEEMLSLSSEEIVKLIHPEDQALFFGNYKARLMGKQIPPRYDFRAIRKDGSIRWIELFGSRIEYQGKPAVQAAFMDITERKLAEKALYESEQKYRLLVENLNAGIWYIDKDANTTYVNPRMAEILGYESGEIIGKHLFEFMDEKWKEISQDYLKRRKSGVKEQHYFEFIKKDGNRLCASVETAPIIDNNGNYIGALAGIQDITDRKRAEDLLKESEEKYRTVVENAKEAILVLQDGIIKFFNPKAIEIACYSKEEFLSRSFVDLIYPDDLEKVMERHQRILDGEDLLEPNIYRVSRKDGSLRWVEGTGVSIQWEGRSASLSFISDITEKKEAEDALRESEERYRKLVETSNDGIAVIQDGKVVFINRIFTELSEYKKEEILDEPFDKFIYPEDLHNVIDNYSKRISGEEVPQTYEFKLVDKSGRLIPIETNAVMIDWYGKPAILSFLRDITERKQAEEKIREINERMEATLNALPDILFEVDRHGRIYDFRAPHPELLYATPQEFLGRTVNEILPEEASNVIMDAIGRAVKKGQHTGAIYHLETPLGAGLFELSIAVKGDPKTQDGRLICLVRDITERKVAEEALRKSEEKFRILVEKVPVGILYLDHEGRIIYENPASRMISGGEVNLSKESTVVGMGIFELQGIMSISGIQDVIQKILNGETVLNFTGPIETTESKKLYIQASATPLYDLEGNQSGAIIIYSDVTEKKRLEDQLIQSQKMEAVGTLAGGIAHNFNNILVGIMGYSEFLLSQKSEQDPNYKALKTIHEGAIRASFLTRELLNLARRGEYKPAKVSLNHVVGKTLPLITGTFNKSIEIETHLADDLMIIEGDSSQLEQSLLNICINARDAMPKDGKIIVETYNQKIDSKFINTHMDVREGDYVVLSVTDTGIGMSNEVKEHIFEPFFTTKEEKGGTGMGLSTVYGIVKNHGGLIITYSEKGKGSTFKLYFPAIKGTLKIVPAREDEEKYTGSATILLVDDEQVVIDMWGGFLLKQGYKVLTSQDGEKALKVFKEKKNEIDLVILDYVMPKMGGRETLIRLKEIDPNVKVLVTSGYSENGPIREIIAVGAKGFIQKPTQLNQLYRKIVKILK